MNKQALSLAVFIAGAYPAASNALGLGDIESSSHLNQPLRAKIELLSGVPADASQLQVRLASPDVFNRVGVARPDFLNTLQFTPTIQGGKPVILVTSSAPIQEPFVNFLLEVSWPQGQLLKEYTVMLDPPVLLKPGNTVAGEASVRAEPRSAGTVNRQQPQPRQQQAAAPEASARPDEQAAPAPRQQPAGNRTYRVKPGDTLFRVATRLQQAGVSNDQMMVALFRANPGAFVDGNINNLRSGAILRAPASSAASALSRAEARRHIRQQNAEWRELRQSLAKNTVPQRVTGGTAKVSKGAVTPETKSDKARLEVLGAKSGQSIDKNTAVASGAVSTKLAEAEQQLSLAREALAARQKENEELKSRVGDLESMLSKKNRLIALRNDQLSGMQKQLTDKGIPAPPLPDLNEEAATDQTVKAATPGTPTPEPGNQPQTTPANTDPAAGIQNHVGNVDGQNAETVLRTENPPADPANGNPPATSETNTNTGTVPAGTGPALPTNPPAPEQAQTPPQPETNSGSVPLTPPEQAAVTPPEEQPAQPAIPEPTMTTATVVPITPPIAAPDKPKTPPAAFVDDKAASDDIMELLTSPMALKIYAGSLGLLLLLGLLSRGLKSKPPETEPSPRGKDEKKINGKGKPEQIIDPPDIKPPEPPELPEPPDDDLLTEANVYIAYGLYQQAESELKKGIERQPEKLEYRHKLLECYFAANNREVFDRHAEHFAHADGKDKDVLWKSIAEWGRKLSPDNKLYRTDLQAINGRDTTTTAVIGAVAGGAAAATLATADNPFDDPFGGINGWDLGDDNPFGTEPALEASVEKLPVVTVPPATSTPTVVEPAEVEKNPFEGLDIDDIDIDLDKLLQNNRPAEAEDQPKVVTTAPVGADKNDDFEIDRFIDIDDSEFFNETAETLATSATHANTSFGIDDGEEESDIYDGIDDVLNELQPVTNPIASTENKAATSHVANLRLTLDNSNVNRILPTDSYYTDKDKQDWIGDIDDILSFIDPEGDDEAFDLGVAHVNTKLDLARAYLDMGDIEGARSTLEEVMVEGNDDQRHEAKFLLHQTG